MYVVPATAITSIKALFKKNSTLKANIKSLAVTWCIVKCCPLLATVNKIKR